MHGPTCIVWANLTPFSAFKSLRSELMADGNPAVRLGINPIVALEKQRLNMIGKLV
jgi:hypothetical protein